MSSQNQNLIRQEEIEGINGRSSATAIINDPFMQFQFLQGGEEDELLLQVAGQRISGPGGRGRDGEGEHQGLPRDRPDVQAEQRHLPLLPLQDLRPVGHRLLHRSCSHQSCKSVRALLVFLRI